MAEGHTLTAAQTVVFAELSWVPGLIDQCEARAHRIGQKSKVLVQMLVLRGCKTDRLIYETLESKHSHSHCVLDGQVPETAFFGSDAPMNADTAVSTCAESSKKHANTVAKSKSSA